MGITNERLKTIKKEVEKLKKKGLDFTLATEGKDLEKIAKRKDSFDRFMARRKVAEERPSVEKQYHKIVEKLEKKFDNTQKNKLKRKVKKVFDNFKAMFDDKETGKKNFALFRVMNMNEEKIFKDIDEMSKTDRNILNYELDNVDYVEKFKQEEAEYFDVFVNRYFQMFKGDVALQERIKNIQKELYHNPSRMRDLVDIMKSEEFKGDYGSDQDNWRYQLGSYEIQKDRLERVEIELSINNSK